MPALDHLDGLDGWNPTKRPRDVDIALFRENNEDVYSGKELEVNSDEVLALNKFEIN